MINMGKVEIKKIWHFIFLSETPQVHSQVHSRVILTIHSIICNCQYRNTREEAIKMAEILYQCSIGYGVVKKKTNIKLNMEIATHVGTKIRTNCFAFTCVISSMITMAASRCIYIITCKARVPIWEIIRQIRLNHHRSPTLKRLS